MTIKSLIIQFLEDNGPKFGGQIEDYIRSVMGSKASNASRRCRELCQDGVIEREAVKVEGVPNMVVRYRIKEAKIPIIGTIQDGKINYRPEIIEQRRVSENQKSLL